MSNLTTTAPESVDLLLSLAAEFNINLGSEAGANGGGGNRIWTNFTNVQGIRTLQSSWMDGGAAAQFIWNQENQTSEFLEEFDGFSGINQLGGFIVHAELQSALSTYDPENNKSKTYCSTTGYQDGNIKQLVKALPGYVPLRGMYDGWDQGANRPNYTKPAPLVKTLGLVGSKGMACMDCIAAGQSTRTDEEGKVTECSLRGKLFFYVTEVSKSKKQPPKKAGDEPVVTTVTKTIRELLDVPGILVAINLPTKSGLRGHYDPKNKEACITGYASYIMQLQMAAKGKPALADPRMHFTTISIKLPPDGGKNPKNMLHFANQAGFNVELLRDARKVWTDVNPNKEVEILDPSEFHKGQAQVAATGGAIEVMAEVVPDVVLNDNPF